MYYGETVRRATFGNVALREARHRGAEVLPWHDHAAPYVTFVLSGEYEEESGRASRIIRAPSVVVHQAGERHRDRFGSEARLIDLQWVRGTSDGTFDCARSDVAAGPRIASIASRLARELALPDEHSASVVEGVAAEIGAELRCEPRNRGVRPAWLRRIEEMVRERWNEPLEVEVLANEAGVHRGHLAREFRRHFGSTVGEFRRQIRLERAREMLEGDDPIAEIALATGFTDQSHLTRAFRHAWGVTPGHYRRKRAR